MTVFDSSGLMDRARRNPATWGPPSGFFDNLSAGYSAFIRGERTVSVGQAVNEEYELLAEEAQRITGDKRIQPPTTATFAESVSGGGAGAEIENLNKRKRDFLSKIAKVNANHGTELADSEDKIMERVREKARLSEEQFAEVSRRSTVAGSVGAFFGAAGASFTDPPILAASLVGAPASLGRLAYIATEAGINAGTEAVAQPFIQHQREELGLPNSTARALFAIAAAGVGGALLPALGMGLKGGARKLARTVQDKLETKAHARRLAEFAIRTDAMAHEMPFLPIASAREAFVTRPGAAPRPV